MSNNDIRDEEIRELIEDEQSRGKRRPSDPSARRKRRERINEIRDLMKLRNRKDFIDALKRLGVEPGSPAFDAALRAWHESVEPWRHGR